MNTLSLNLGSYAGSARGNYGYAGGNYRGGFNSPVNDNNYAQYSTAENYTMQLQLIQKYMQEGEVAKAMALYEDLMQYAQNASAEEGIALDDAELANVMAGAYGDVNGTNILEDVEASTDSPFMSGLKQGLPIIGWFLKDTNEAEATAKITNTEVSGKDKFAEIAGAFLTGGLIGVVRVIAGNAKNK